MRLETEQLEYWGNRFMRHGLNRYMTFAAFMVNPRKYWRELMGGPCRPPASAAQRIVQSGRGLELAMERLEAQVDHLRRINNGHPYEQLKHHANGR
ncbi:hypothetical protein [Alloalcanivorax xenomutans]